MRRKRGGGEERGKRDEEGKEGEGSRWEGKGKKQKARGGR